MPKTKLGSIDSVTSRRSRSKRCGCGCSVNDPLALDVRQVGQTSAIPILTPKIWTQRPVTDTKRSHSQSTQSYINLDVQFNCSSLWPQPSHSVMKKTTQLSLRNHIDKKQRRKS